MNIYQLPEAVNEAMERFMLNFNEDTGEEETDSTEAMKELQELQNKKDELIEWMLKKRGNSQARGSAIESEIKRLIHIQNKEQKIIDQMNKLIEHFIPNTIDKPVTISNWSISYRKSEKAIIDDKESIPEKYKVYETVTTEKIPLDPIKKAIKEGKMIPGVHIEEKMNLQIK